MGFFSKLKHAVSHVAHMAEHELRTAVAVQARAFGAALKIATGHPKAALEELQKGAAELAHDPLFSLAQGAAKFVPGFGTAVSAGLGGLQAIGEGHSLQDAVLGAARSAIPAGPAQAAFDTAIGIAHHGGVSPAAMLALRHQLPGGQTALAAFDAGLSLAHGHHPELHDVLTAAMPASARAVLDRVQAAGRAARAPRDMTHGMPTALQSAVNKVLVSQGKLPQHVR